MKSKIKNKNIQLVRFVDECADQKSVYGEEIKKKLYIFVNKVESFPFELCYQNRRLIWHLWLRFRCWLCGNDIGSGGRICKGLVGIRYRRWCYTGLLHGSGFREKIWIVLIFGCQCEDTVFCIYVNMAYFGLQKFYICSKQW